MRTVRVILILGIALILMSSCSDDESALPTSSNDVRNLVMGVVVLRPYVDFHGSIYPVFGQDNEIDSVKFGDSLCEITKLPAFVEGNSYNYGFGYVNKSDSLRFGSGDTVRIVFYRGPEIATVGLSLLTIENDTVSIKTPLDSAVIPTSEDLTVVWSKVPNASWYSVYHVFDTSNVFGAELRQVYDFTTDTSYTIPGTEHTMNGSYRIFVGAVSGPVPGQAGNVLSQSMTGSIYSWAIPGVRQGRQVIVGTGPSGFPAPDSIKGFPYPHFPLW